MAENINTANLFSSGGHRWVWGVRDQGVKQLQTPGESGAARFVLGSYARPCTIQGMDGGPAVLVGTNDADIDGQEAAIEALVNDSTVCDWEDDAGHSGASLQVVRYERIGERHTASVGGAVWQFYKCTLIELDGGPTYAS